DADQGAIRSDPAEEVVAVADRLVVRRNLRRVGRAARPRHIEEDRTVLKNYYRALKPGGVLLISTPSDQGGSDVHHEHDESFIEEHVRDGYGISEMDEKLNAAGFRDNHLRYSYGKPGKLSWKLSMKFPIRLVNAGKIFFILLPFYYLVTYPFCFLLNMADVRNRHSTGTGLIVLSKK
ncbi:MAG: hypothetical protein ACWGNV_08045, partial [Bacteroidales bacterium]